VAFPSWLLGRSFRRSTSWGSVARARRRWTTSTRKIKPRRTAGGLDVADGRAPGRDSYVHRERGVEPARSKSARSEPPLLGFMSMGQTRLLNETAQHLREFDELAVVGQHGELQEARPVIEAAMPSWSILMCSARGRR